MSHDYKIVQWTPFKTQVDVVLLIGISLFIGAYVGAALMPSSGRAPHEMQIAMRAFGGCAFALLTLILAIGPLARLSPRFLPLLYNRRHLGVACFLLALTHAVLVVIWYHAFSDLDPFTSLLTSNPRYDSIRGFPFESLGLIALAILFVMAATSHDFWNTVLGPALWKAIHMAVYWAYALIVAHVMLGAVQAEKSFWFASLVGAGAACVAGLHIIAGRRERVRDAKLAADSLDGWIAVGALGDIPDQRARIVTPPTGERIAVFRDGDQVFAISNVCRHQGGPLGEGAIIDGCVTCPWHGYQYRPQDGRAPPPFTERVATYRTRIEAGSVFVHPDPAPFDTGEAPS